MGSWAGWAAAGCLLALALGGLGFERASEAAGPAGTVSIVTRSEGRQIVVEVHDNGPGLSADAAATLFAPTISFKRRGMGLGLSIARKNALVSGGDIMLIRGELGGAAFRVTLPASTATEPSGSGH